MTAPQLEDRDIEDLFNTPELCDDGEVFERRVMNGLKVRLWLRQWLVVLAGFVGGIYALAQLVRVPEWTMNGRSVVRTAAVETDETWRAGVELIDVGRGYLMELMDRSGEYLTYMQTPAFFWVAFSLCLGCVGLYYAYSQEETI